MKVIAYCVRPDELESFAQHSKALDIELTLVNEPFSAHNADAAKGHDAVIFIGNCRADRDALTKVAAHGIRYLSTRSAGSNNIDLQAAKELGLSIANVGRYSPYSVAEFTLTITLALLRNLHRTIKRTQVQNYSLNGLIGQELHTKTVGIIGTGNIGLTTAKVFSGLCKRIIAYDVYENPKAKGIIEYMPLKEMLGTADIVALHCPYNLENHHLINAEQLAAMQPHAYLVNTARGELVDTKALVDALQHGRLAGYAGDVYEKEVGIVHQDHTNDIINDPMFLGLVNMPNVLFTPHYAFYTDVAVDNMVEYALQNVHDFYLGKPCPNQLV